MKKLLSVFMLFACLVVPAYAAEPSAGCVIREDICSNDDEYLTIIGKRGCYVCETGKCISGDLVVATDARLAKKSYKNHAFLCQLGAKVFGNDRWVPAPVPTCSAKDLILQNDANAVEKIINRNTGEAISNDNDAQVVNGASPCIGWACKDGFTEQNGKCVDNILIATKANCESTGGVYANGTCRCNGANMRTSGDGKSCECINDKYEYDANTKQCKETAASIQARNDAEMAAATQVKKSPAQNLVAHGQIMLVCAPQIKT